MDDELVDIARFETPVEAHLAKLRLDEAGVLAFVIGENLGGLRVFGVGGDAVRVQVRAADAARATEVLARVRKELDESFDPDVEEAEPDAVEPSPDGAAGADELVEVVATAAPEPERDAGRAACPACGGARVERVPDPAARGLRRLFDRSGRRCGRCGHRWSASC